MPDVPPRNDRVLEAIRRARAEAPFGDTRPLHRAIQAGNFLVPTLEPARLTSDGHTGLKPVEFFKNDLPSFVAFTDLETLRDVMAREDRPDSHWTPLYGHALTRMAVRGGFARLVLNINAEDNYVMFPMVFGTLADGFVPAALASDAEHADEPLRLLVTEGGPPPERRPPTSLGPGLRRALELPPESPILWFESGWPPDELRFNVALDLSAASDEEARSVYAAVQTEWISHWPAPMPLGVHALAALNPTMLRPYAVSL